MPLKDQSNATVMKPAVDEMFPEGAGPYVDLDEVSQLTGWLNHVLIKLEIDIKCPYNYQLLLIFSFTFPYLKIIWPICT